MSWYEDYFHDYDDFYDDSDEELHGVTIVHSTDKAMLIEHNNKRAWFPKSVCELAEDMLFYQSWFEPKWDALNTRKPSEIEGDFI